MAHAPSEVIFLLGNYLYGALENAGKDLISAFAIS